MTAVGNMEAVAVIVAAQGNNGSRSSTARISREWSGKHCIAHGSCIQLRTGQERPRFFRVVVDSEESHLNTSGGHGDVIYIDHWPSYEQIGELATGSTKSNAQRKATVEVVAPARLRVGQYVSLHPAGPDQPKLPLAMAKALLKRLILHGPEGVIHMQWQGIEYGAWRYRAYYRGGGGGANRATRRRLHDEAGGDDHSWMVDAGIVTDDTMVSILPFSSSESNDASSVSTKLEQPGIGSQGEPLHDLLSLALFPPQDERLLNTRAMQPRSLLLHGPSGSGKTTLVRLVAQQLDVNLLALDCSILATPQFRVEDVFTAALRIQPCVVLLEDLELIFPRALDETKYKLVCRFVACLDHIRAMKSARVVVVGNVTTLRALNAKIGQVFEEELFLKAPDKAWTIRLFETLLPSPEDVSEELKFAVAVKYGQRPSNIVALARRLHEHQTFRNSHDSVKIRSDIEKFGREIATSAGSSSTQALQTSVPNVQWSDIGGLSNVKQSLLEMVVWPLEKPDVFLRMGISPPLGMLLHGPPGTGKTMLAKASARASGCNFLNVSASDLMKAEFGESEKAITRVFDTARALSPCMVFIDEFQSLFGNRTTAGVTTSRMISQLLMEMDTLKAIADDRDHEISSSSTKSQSGSGPAFAGDRVFVLAATNALSAIDPAFLQPGRFENILFVGLPSVDERQAILKLQGLKMPWHGDIDLGYLADATEGANAASIVALCQAAAIKAMQRIDVAVQEPLIEMQDFVRALEDGNAKFNDREQTS